MWRTSWSTAASEARTGEIRLTVRTARSIPTRSPAATCISFINPAAPGRGRSSCGRGWRSSDGASISKERGEHGGQGYDPRASADEARHTGQALPGSSPNLVFLGTLPYFCFVEMPATATGKRREASPWLPQVALSSCAFKEGLDESHRQVCRRAQARRQERPHRLRRHAAG